MVKDMKDSDILYGLYQAIEGNLSYIMIVLLILFSIYIMFYWEGKVVIWWLRLPLINLLLFIILLILGTIEEIYLTFHPNKRTKFAKTSIFQIFFNHE